MTLSLLLVTALSLPSAQAASSPDLVTTLTPPSAIEVDQAGVWTVQVANIGNRDAANVPFTMALPWSADDLVLSAAATTTTSEPVTSTATARSSSSAAPSASRSTAPVRRRHRGVPG